MSIVVHLLALLTDASIAYLHADNLNLAHLDNLLILFKDVSIRLLNFTHFQVFDYFHSHSTSLAKEHQQRHYDSQQSFIYGRPGVFCVQFPSFAQPFSNHCNAHVGR